MSATTICTRCGNPTKWNVIGTFRNGRPALDPRCHDHRPDNDEIGCYLLLFDYHGLVAVREYKAIEIRSVPA